MLWLSPPSLGIHRRLLWHPGIPRDRVAVSVATAGSTACLPSGLRAALLCSEKLTGAVKSRGRLSLGAVGTRKPHETSTMLQAR